MSLDYPTREQASKHPWGAWTPAVIRVLTTAKAIAGPTDKIHPKHLLLDSAEAQRMALCWFLRRGSEEDFTQGELIDFLGVSSPCVLSLAGYPQEAARRVMDMLGDITRDEIGTAKPF